MKKNYILISALIIILVLNITSFSQKSITVDESIHIPAGYSYLKTFDYSTNPEHPPLVKYMAAFPLLFLNPAIDTTTEIWKQQKEEAFHGFFFDLNKNADQIVFWARLPMLIFALLLAYYIFRWAKELYGEKAAYLALFLFTFSPNILAHSRLVTTDAALACFSVISLYYFWHFLKNQSTKNLILTGIFFGLAQISKYTAVYLIPIFIVVLLYYIYNNKQHFLVKRSRKLYLKLFAIFLIGLLFINLAYGFKSPFSVESKSRFAQALTKNSVAQSTVYTALAITPVPAAYVDGLGLVSLHSIKGHDNYLLGSHSKTGWWYYFIIAFLIKTPIPTILFLLFTLLLFKKLKKENLDEAFLIIPVVIFFGVFFFNHINIGLRHVLPIYPFIFIFSSKIINIKLKQKYYVIIPLCLWYVISSIWIYPHYLAYFNEFAGGPDNGHKYLIDSNIDWGQDLKGLKKYMDKNNIDKLNLGYEGIDSPEYRGIKHSDVNCFHTSGIVAISVNTMLFDKELVECYSWLNEYTPIDKIGYSIFIYNIPKKLGAEEKEKQEFCTKGCMDYCFQNNLEYLGFDILEDSCNCKCG